MDPTTVLERLAHGSFEESAETDPAEGPGCKSIFPHIPFEGPVKQLYTPTTEPGGEEDHFRPFKTRAAGVASDFDGFFRFEKERVRRLLPSVEFPMIPSDNGNLKFIEDALMLLWDCIADIPGFTLRQTKETLFEIKNAETIFEALLKAFLDYMETIPIEEVNIENEVESTVSSFESDIAVNISTLYEPIRQLLRCVTHWCHWALQLSACTQDALRLAQSTLTRKDSRSVLETAILLKESNRNMAFYSLICDKLVELMKTNDTGMDGVVSTLLCKIQYIKHLLHVVSGDEETNWKTLSSQLSSVAERQNEIPFEEQEGGYVHNINLVRNEMRTRMDRKGYTDSLARECEMLQNELDVINLKRQAIAGRFEQITKQLQDLVSPGKSESQIDSLKITDTKRLCPLLQHFLVRLNLQLLHTPNREVAYKVVKEREYALHVSLLPPRDMLMPGSDATSPAFPLVFVIYMDENEKLQVKEPALVGHNGSVFVSSGESSGTLKGASYRTWPMTSDPDWGLEDFTVESVEIPPIFMERIRTWYEMAHLHVWNCYIIDNYRRLRLDVAQFLPKELQRKHVSQYSVIDSVLTLSNNCASVRISIEFNEMLEPRCQFDDFQQKNVLKVEHDKGVIEPFIKDFHDVNKSNITEYLSDMHKTVLSRFDSQFRTIRLAVMLEVYAFVFDWICSRKI